MTDVTPAPFGFRVEAVTSGWEDDEMEFVTYPEPRWHVHLPHQCDSWDIAGGYSEPVDHTAAVALLASFIAEASSALAALLDGREFDDGEPVEDGAS